MFCRHHRNLSDCVLYPERCDLHNNILENLMGDLTKVTADAASLIAYATQLKTENDQLKADAATQSDADQAAINALDDQIVAALPAAAPVTDAPADGSTPIADSIPTDGTADPNVTA